MDAKDDSISSITYVELDKSKNDVKDFHNNIICFSTDTLLQKCTNLSSNGEI